MRCRFLIIFLLTFAYASAQVNLLNKDMFRSRVGMIDEFMSRFNMDTFSPTVNIKDEDMNRMNLYSLYNIERMSSSQELINLGIEFADSVLKNNIKLAYSDSNWVAKATCVGTLSKKEVNFVLYLGVQPRGTDMYKWVIKAAEGEFLTLKTKSSNSDLMIGPDNHEINFMSLNDITSSPNNKNITAFSYNDYDVEPLTVFNTLVYQGLLKIESVSDLIFIFYQVPGFQFEVQYVNNESSNAGWLINSIKKY